MKCPVCGTNEFAGFNGFVLCVPRDDSVPTRFSNDEFNALLAAAEAAEAAPDLEPVPAPAPAPAPVPVPVVVPDPVPPVDPTPPAPPAPLTIADVPEVLG